MTTDPDTTDVPMVAVPVELIDRCRDILNQTIEAGTRCVRDHHDAAILAEMVRTHADLQDALNAV